jgi:hypothetical protein
MALTVRFIRKAASTGAILLAIMPLPLCHKSSRSVGWFTMLIVGHAGDGGWTLNYFVHNAHTRARNWCGMACHCHIYSYFYATYATFISSCPLFIINAPGWCWIEGCTSTDCALAMGTEPLEICIIQLQCRYLTPYTLQNPG